MKFPIILTILLIVLIAVGGGQGQRRRRERCAGRPRNPSCSGNRNDGRRGFRCTARNMFYYDAATRQCRSMRYRGCGGNNNRWCSEAHCRQRCIR